MSDDLVVSSTNQTHQLAQTSLHSRSVSPLSTEPTAFPVSASVLKNRRRVVIMLVIGFMFWPCMLV